MSELSLRRATAADVDGVTTLVERSYGHYVEELGFRPGPLNWDYTEEIANKEAWVVPAEGELEALLVLRPESDHLFVDNVAVVPGVKGTGIGRRLLEYAERRARELGIEELRLVTNVLMSENRAIYAHLGWAEGDEITEDGFSRVEFSKSTPD